MEEGEDSKEEEQARCLGERHWHSCDARSFQRRSMPRQERERLVIAMLKAANFQMYNQEPRASVCFRSGGLCTHFSIGPPEV